MFTITYIPPRSCCPHTRPISAEYGGLVEVSGAYEAVVSSQRLAPLCNAPGRFLKAGEEKRSETQEEVYLVLTYAMSRNQLYVSSRI